MAHWSRARRLRSSTLVCRQAYMAVSLPAKPPTALGRKLLAARAEYQRAGGRLLSPDQMCQEVAARRGEH